MRQAGIIAMAIGLTLGVPAIAEDPAPLPADRAIEHVVKPGETLGGIAARAKVPRVLIAEANGLEPPYVVRTGQRLVIPRTRHHVVARGETGFTIAYLYAVPWRDIAVANNLDAGATIRPGQKLLIPTVLQRRNPAAGVDTPTRAATATDTPRFAWPLSGDVRRGFSPRARANYHDGLDIPAREGTAVRAAAAGKVLFAGTEPRQFGRMVVLEHPGGWQTAYAFLSRVTVKAGEDVSAGERVGLVGRTGQAKGSELHFEIRRDARPVDPLEQLPRQP
ncbi:MAG: M23 family metallopeptidase [Novosphingobium sp.]